MKKALRGRWKIPQKMFLLVGNRKINSNMKKIILYMCVAVVAMACTKNDADTNSGKIQSKYPSTIYASIDGQTRAELHWENGAPKTYWSVGDQIALYDGEKFFNAYKLNENIPTKNGSFSIVSDASIETSGTVKSEDLGGKTVAVYPYGGEATLAKVGDNIMLQYILPNVQTYAGSNTYGSDANIMVAVEDVGSTDYSFKNLMGYLKITLKGIKKIDLYGSYMEPLHGVLAVNYDDENNCFDIENSKIMSPSYDDHTITLDCGEGAMLNNDDGVSFIFALPPMTFERGINILATDVNDVNYFKYASDDVQKIKVGRNVIKPMEPLTINSGGFNGYTILYYTPEDKTIKDNTDATFKQMFKDANGNTVDLVVSFGLLRFFGVVAKISDNAFYDTILKSVTIPATITEIGNQAFANCSNLSAVYCNPKIPPTLGDDVFEGCNSELKIYVPSESIAAYKEAWSAYESKIQARP